jgi:Spy/CpxP family protein refolding chaperone
VNGRDFPIRGTGALPIATIEEFPVFRHHLGALALLAAFALPLAASAQTVPVPGAAAPAPAVHQHQHRHHHRNRYMHAMRGLGLSNAQKQQIEGILTDTQRNQLHAKLAQGRQRGVNPNRPGPQAPPQ